MLNDDVSRDRPGINLANRRIQGHRYRVESVRATVLGRDDGFISCPRIRRVGLNFHDADPLEVVDRLLAEAGLGNPEALRGVVDVPAGLGVVQGGTIPYTPAARARRDSNRADWLQSDPEIKCYLPGIPRANYMGFGFQIVQNPAALLFSYEYAGAVRNIHLSDPGPAPIDSWMGQSWLRWEGDTMVIETTGFNGQTWLDRAGNFHSDQLKVTERFTRTSDHTMHYEATLEDPTVYTRPWTISMPVYRRVPPDDRLLQFNCVEFVEELLYGHLRKHPLP